MLLTKILPIYIMFFELLQTVSTNIQAEVDCNSSTCSLVYDPVCGMVKTKEGTITIKIYQNLCTLLHIGCDISETTTVIKQIPDELCKLKKPKAKRRVADFGIVGAHQACNHTCPTYCIDTYEPACATVWNPDMTMKFNRPMLNHCHVDLFSCSMGFNVSIQPLNKCFSDSSRLMFMSQVAGLKSLGLLYDGENSNEAARNDQPQRTTTRVWRRLLNF